MTYTLRLYMKSGNVVKLPMIAGWKFTGTSRIELQEHESTKTGVERIVMTTLDLDQVEAVTSEITASADEAAS